MPAKEKIQQLIRSTSEFFTSPSPKLAKHLERKHVYFLILLVLSSMVLTYQMFIRVEDQQSFASVDAEEYISIAKNLQKGNGYKITEGGTFRSDKETSYRTPGYPFLLLAIRGVFKEEKYIGATVLYQHLLLAFMPLMFYFLAFSSVKNKNYAMLTAFLSFMFYPIRYLATIIHPDFTAMFLLLAALCLFIRNMRQKHLVNMVGFSLFLGLSIMIKQNLVILMALFLYPLPTLLKRKEFIVALLFPFLFISAWVIRNYTVHHRFPVFTTNTGINFFFANTPDIGANLTNITGYSSVMKDLMFQGYSEVDADRELLKRGFKKMIDNGLWWQIKRFLAKIRVNYRDFYPPSKNEVFFLVLPFVLLMKRRKIPLLALILYQVIYAISAYQPGFNFLDIYHAGVLDIVSLNFIGIAALVLFLRKRNKRFHFMFWAYVFMLLPTLIFFPLDRLTITADFLLVLAYGLSPLLFKEYFHPAELPLEQPEKQAL